jgi:hypothetical protein
MQLEQFRNVHGKAAARQVAQWLQQRVPHDFDVPVFTKNQGDDEPVVASAHLAVGAVVAVESPVFEPGNVWHGPVRPALADVVLLRIVCDIFAADARTCGDGPHRPPDAHTVHGDFVAFGEIALGELVLGRDGFQQLNGLSIKGDLVARWQVLQGDDYIVVGMYFQYVVTHGRLTYRVEKIGKPLLPYPDSCGKAKEKTWVLAN